MVVTYVDIFGLRVLPGLERLLEAEFKGTAPVYISEEYIEKGSESIRLSIPENASEQIAQSGTSETRIYRIDGTYYINMAAGRERIEEILRRIGRINRIVIDNESYAVSGVYQWHGAKLGIWGESPPEAGEPEGYGIARFQFECTVHEAIL